ASPDERTLAVGRGAGRGAVAERHPPRARTEGTGDRRRGRVPGAQIEEALLGLEPEVDRPRHVIGAHDLELLALGPIVRRLLDQAGVGLVRGLEEVRVDGLVAVLEELDLARRVGQRVLALEHSERPGPAGEDVHTAVLRALEHLGDLAGAADRPKPVVGEPHDPELRLGVEAVADHGLVALLEDVERHDLGRQRHHRQREEGEVALDRLHTFSLRTPGGPPGPRARTSATTRRYELPGPTARSPPGRWR